MKAHLLLGILLLAPLAPLAHAQDGADPAEVAIGERLFLETRFAQFFAANAMDINQPLPDGGDPVVEANETTGDPLPGPFAGQAINCRSCHLVDEQLAFDSLGFPDQSVGGMRTYADFARRSPVPARVEDGHTHTARNSPALVNASLARRGGVEFHFDGEFTSMHELVRETLLGRNYGWLPAERKQALAHIARVIRQDNGHGELASGSGGAYRLVLAGLDPRIPEELVLPRLLRIDVAKASDAQIVEAVAKLITKYVQQLEFARDASGAFSGSPFDLFLLRNNLPRKPRVHETPDAYSRRLAAALDGLTSPLFVADVDGPFALHAQVFQFDARELEGLRIFLRRPPEDPNAPQPSGAPSGTGNCVACHPAPFFSDFSFHDTGVTQGEYDNVHGGGSFASLAIPALEDRSDDPNAFLPPTSKHPFATGRFRAAASVGNTELTDLGAWNVLFNKDFAHAQGRLRGALKRSLGGHPNRDELLAASIARFKTPGLRDLGHSNPYMHNGAFDTLEEVVQFYIDSSNAQRGGILRNGAAELAGIELSPGDVAPLAAFLRSLNEDYQ
jgi:hypothetical protein